MAAAPGPSSRPGSSIPGSGARPDRTAAWLVAGGAAGVLSALGLVILAKTIVGGAPPQAMDPPRFVEEANSAGVLHSYDGEWPFFVGGGVSVFDCNGDGKPELYFAGGTNRAALYRNESPVGGQLRFTPLADPTTALDAVTGAYPLDIDSDGITDLAVLRLGENVLLRGTGECRFERANEAWGFEGGEALTTAFSAKWEGSATLPTLAVGNYVDAEGGCSDNALLRPEAESAAYGIPTLLRPGWCTLSILFSDWDRSGRRDLRMTNDRHYSRDGEEQLWWVAEGQAPRLYTPDEGWQRMRIWGMGIASYDLTGDGFPEVFLTSQGDNKLQTLAEGAGQPNYHDIALPSGATAHRPFVGDVTLPSTAWHPEFQDVNNDAYIDLFVAKGNVDAMPDYAAEDPSNLLLGQPGGTFDEAAQEAGIVSFGSARGAALADLNLDGMLDLVVVNRRENVKLWRNVGWGRAEQPEQMGGWLGLRLHQPSPNRDAIGAWIEVRAGDRTLLRELTVGGGHGGGQLGWIHFGLGSADTARVRVQWPDGQQGPWLTIPADRFALVERGADQAEVWVPTEGG